ncbi:MAG: ATP synthase F1 subunit delta [Clostridia bacterium]|nr:ATP synthase F1 subunit delta [Clostridia bacterium]
MTQISKEYAAALFSIAVEKACVPKWEAQLRAVEAELKAQPDYVRLLTSPDIPAEERVSLLRAAFAQDTDEEVVSFAALMCRRGRAAQLPEAIERFCQLADERARIRVATVESARPLREDEKKRLIAALEKKTGGTVELRCEVDPALMGGLRVTVDGRVIDGSVRERLREIKEVIGG